MICLEDRNIKNIKKYCSSGGQIVCFGSGKSFYNFWNIIDDDELLDKVKYVIDNDELKQGQAIKLKN